MSYRDGQHRSVSRFRPASAGRTGSLDRSDAASERNRLIRGQRPRGPHGEPPPASANLRVPADLGFVPAIRAAVGAAAAGIGLDLVSAAQLRRGADELAVALIPHARPWAHLDIAIDHDDEDVYLRMAVDQDDPDRSLRLPMSRLVLAGIADSVDVQSEDARIYGVVQRRLPREG